MRCLALMWSQPTVDGDISYSGVTFQCATSRLCGPNDHWYEVAARLMGFNALLRAYGLLTLRGGRIRPASLLVSMRYLAPISSELNTSSLHSTGWTIRFNALPRAY